MNAGQRLRTLREKLGLTIRDVETASTLLAQKYGNEDYAIPISRLSDIETKGVIPSIFRLYSFAVIYRSDFRELLTWFGIDMDQMARDFHVVEPARTHVVAALNNIATVQLPVKLDPSLDLRRTVNLGRMIERWGAAPMAFLQQFAGDGFTYGYIGTEDFTMYPLLLPGSFIQVDESRDKIVERQWSSEYDRPIYFIETRQGHTCSWCALRGDDLILQPHPLSPVPPRILRNEHEAEVIGQVTAVAMRLADWHPVGRGKGPRELRESN